MMHPVTPASAIASLLRHRALVWELVKRDFAGRYKGSYAGAAWSLLNPLFLLAIYTFVFSVAFPARWVGESGARVPFAVILFAGMIVYNLFADCLLRSATLVTSVPNYVKKVVFPLDLLPWVALFTALLHFLVGFAILVAIAAIAGEGVAITSLWVPVVLLPLMLFTIGLTWAFASLGVYLRDLPQAIGVLVTVLMFLSPLFFPIEVVPAPYRVFIHLSPLTLPIEQLRGAVLWGRMPDWGSWSLSLAVGAFMFVAGYWWFQRTRRGFSDVL